MICFMKKKLKEVWRFLWKSDSILSWVVSFILAFIIVKFLIYPGLGLIMGTGYPIVAVVSSSMEHHNGLSDDELTGFAAWWEENKEWYENKNIDIEEFEDFSFKNGFNKGDIMVLVGKPPQSINIGDILVFESNLDNPVIHRVVDKWEEDGKYYFQTKGDNNGDSGQGLDELKISEDRLIGKAVLRVPYLGWLKIGVSGML